MRHHLRRLILMPAIIMAAASMSAISNTLPARAEIFQCGAQSHYLNGYSAFPNTSSYVGVHAHITAQWGSVCDTDTDPLGNFTNSWSLLSDHTGGVGYIQSGFERGYGTGLRHFSQILRNLNTGEGNTIYGSYFSEGEDHGYWQQWDSGCSCIHSNVDLTTFQSTWFNPKAEWPWPFGVQYFGEAAYRESDIPGYAGTQTVIAGLQVQRASDNNFQDTPCFLSYRNDNTARWTQQAYSCTQFNIWTL